MPILMDEILTEYADQAYEAARLRRNGIHSIRDRVFAEVLANLEASRRSDAIPEFTRPNSVESDAEPLSAPEGP